jgi:basic membrane protein A and related proteins
VVGIRLRLGPVVGAIAVLTFGCGGNTASPSSSSSGQPYKVAFVYNSARTTIGWSKAHDDGRLMVERKLGGKVATTYRENVPEGPQTEQVVESLIRDGNKMIFGTSFGFQDPFVNEAAKHPDVKFEVATGFKLADNLAEYNGASEDVDYLRGIALAAASKNGRIGVVCSFPIPQAIREINALVLGAQSIKPGMTAQVVWTNTFSDPAKERKAAEGLIAAGTDTIAIVGVDNPSAGEAADAAGLKWVGYGSDEMSFGPNTWLTGLTYNWGPYYVDRVTAGMNGTWKSGSYYGGFKEGIIALAPLGKSVSVDTKSKMEAQRKALADGSFYEFTGPLKDQSGKEQVPAGTRMTLDKVLTMDWFVQGVVGSPKG